MRSHVFAVMGAGLLLVWTVEGTRAAEPTATVRTYGGVTYSLAGPSLEVFYTIGEPKEKKAEERFGPTISVRTTFAGPAGAGDQMPGAAQAAAEPGAEKEEKLLRGAARAAEIVVSRDGVEQRIPWDRLRTMFFTRKPVATPLLPPYIPHYRYAVSLSLTDGERVEADYVNLGTAVLRGTAPEGRIDIPWEEVESVLFER